MGSAQRSIGGYKLLRQLDGAQGDTYLAVQGDREHVLTLVELKPGTRAALAREIARSDPLRHPAIVPVHDLFEHEGQQVLVHPRLSGVTLRALARHLREQGEPLAPSAICHIGHQLAGALAVAHRARPPVVHARLGPERVVIGAAGEVSLVGVGVGPVLALEPADGFAPPEVRRGARPTPAANTYSLAAILFWLATGEMFDPRQREPLGLLRSDLSADAALLIDRALHAAPAGSGTSCAELAKALAEPAAGGAGELAWNVELLRAIKDVDVDGLPSSEAFPTSAPRSGDEAVTSDGAPTRLRNILPPAPDAPPSLPRELPPRRPRGDRKRTLESVSQKLRDDAGALAAAPSDMDDDALVASVRGSAPRARDIDIPVVQPAESLSEPPTLQRDVGALLAAHGITAPDLPPPSSEEPLAEPPLPPLAEDDAAPISSEDSTRRLRPLDEQQLAAITAERRFVAPSSLRAREPAGSRAGWVAALVLATSAAFALGVVVTRSMLAADPASAPGEPSSTAAPGASAPAGGAAGPDRARPTGAAAPPAATAAEPGPLPEVSAAQAASAPPPGGAPAPAPLDDVPPLGHGFLIVESGRADAHVYAFGKHAGPVNQPLALPCKWTFIRLGTVPPKTWFGPGRSLLVRCGETTRVTLDGGS